MDNPEMEDEEKSYFRIGAGLDCLLTSPERWDNDFLVIDVNRPYGLMGKFVEILPEGLSQYSSYDLYQEAYEKSGYKMDLTKVVGKFWENDEVVRYYKVTRNKGSKVVLSKDEYDIIIKCKELILANPYVVKYFVPQDITTELMHQVPIYFKYRGLDCKGLLDGIFIDHKNKTIQPFDLKTSSKSVYDFNLSFMQFGYYRQCAFYTLALLSEESPIQEYLQEGYKLNNFIFIVVENKLTSSTPAVIYKVSDATMLAGLIGGEVRGKKYKGIDELIDNYIYHTETGKWDLPVDLIKSEGVIELDIFDNAENN